MRTMRIANSPTFPRDLGLTSHESQITSHDPASTRNTPSSRNARNSLKTLDRVSRYPELESGLFRASESVPPSRLWISNRQLQELKSPQLAENTASAPFLIANIPGQRESRAQAPDNRRGPLFRCLSASLHPCFLPSANSKLPRGLRSNHVESLLFGAKVEKKGLPGRRLVEPGR